MKSFLTFIDIYGTKFHFYFHGYIKFNTWIGGIITILISTLLLSFFYIFGEDFFFRKNPSFTYSTIGEDYKKIDLSSKKIVIAFRIEDDFGFALDSKNLIYPMIYYYSAVPNSNGEYLKEYKEEYIPYRKCEEKDFDGNQNLISIYGELNCITMENKPFGGFWDNEFIYYFAIRLFYCSNGNNYSVNNSNCTSFEDLNKFFSNPVLFSIYYTSIDFRVNNIKHPFKRKYKSYYCYLDYKFRKIENIYIQEHILNDDQGWIFSSKKNISVWGGQAITSDYNYYSEKEITTEGFSSMFYALNIYMSSDKFYYTRKYMKIQDIFALIGGLLTCFHFIGKNINKSINLSMKKSKIIDNFFNFIQNENLNENIFSSKNNYSIFKSINSYNILSKQKLFPNRKLSYDGNNSNKNFESFDKIKNHNDNSYTQISRKNIMFKKKVSNENSIYSRFKSKTMNKNITKIIVNRITKEDLKKTVKYFCCLIKRSYKKDVYDITNELYHEKCSLFTYFQSLKEIKFVKEMFLNPQQVEAMDLINKINIYFHDNIPENENKIQKVIKYFEYKYKNKLNSSLDDYIFVKLNEDIKNKIKIN